MLVFYYYFEGGWYVSAVTLMMLQSIPAYKEQLVDYGGVSILLNTINLSVWEAFYCFMRVSLYLRITKKYHAWKHFFAKSDIISLHNHHSYFQ